MDLRGAQDLSLNFVIYMSIRNLTILVPPMDCLDPPLIISKVFENILIDHMREYSFLKKKKSTNKLYK